MTVKAWLSGWRGRLVIAAVVVGLVAAVESIPGVPGHDQAALSADLVVSDAGTVVSTVNPLAGRPKGSCQRIESFYGVGNNLLRDSRLDFYASIWPSYQALEAFRLTSLRSGDESCIRDFEQTLAAIDDNYWAGGLHGVPAAYDQGPAALHISGDLPRIDDSMWMGTTLMEAYRRTRDERFLRRAEAVFALGRGNWDPRHGGIYWEDHAPGATNLKKAVAANGPAAVTDIDLYLATGRRTYLHWAEKIVAWLHQHLLDPVDGLYNDEVDDQQSPPAVSRATFTYDEGIMVGALGLLSTTSPRTHPLRDAVALAQRAMDFFSRHRSYGDPAFDAVWARNLLWLASLYGQPSFTARARGSVEAAIRAEPENSGSLLDFASEISLHDLASLPPRQYGQLRP